MALHRLTPLVLAGVLALGVTACGDDTPPKTAPSTTTATASPSPTGLVAPVLPELAKREDEVGAKAFVKYWFAAVTYAMKTGDTEPFMSVSADDCKTCVGLAQAVDDIYEDGGHLVGGGWRVESIERDPRLAPPLHRYSVRVIQPAQRAVAPDGAVTERVGRREFLFFVGAKWADGYSLFGVERIDD